MLQYKTLTQQYVHEIAPLKGSRFLTTLVPAASRDEAKTLIDSIQKKYSDATHNCRVYRVVPTINTDLFWQHTVEPQHEYSSDDGEPANTAWKPILSALQWEGLMNTLCVVTRYYGGTMLGIWWLIQAYSWSTKQTIQAAKWAKIIIKKTLLTEIHVRYPFDRTGEVMRVCDVFSVSIQTQNISQTEVELIWHVAWESWKAVDDALPHDVSLSCNEDIIS